MSSAYTKSKLKASREAIQKKEWQEAVDAANEVIEQEPSNYNANVFLGLASLNLEQYAASEAAYRKAIEAQPSQLLAYQGLSKFYTQRKDWQKLVTTLLQEADIHLDAQDAVKCGECIQRVIEVQREEGGKRLTAEALSNLLPGSKYYPLLVTLPQPQPAGRHSSTFDVEMAIHMHPLRTISEIVALHEELEQKTVDQEVERKRMRIDGAGKTKDALRREAGVIVWQQSPLPGLYELIMNHGEASDEERRESEGKLLRYFHRLLLALPSDTPDGQVAAPSGTAAQAEQPISSSSASPSEKVSLRQKIVEMARGMVIVGVPDELAWCIHLEWQNISRLTQYSHQTLRQFISIFPRSGRASSFRALLLTLKDAQYLVELEEAKKVRDVDHGDDDLEPLDHAVRGIENSPESSLVQWVAARLYLLERDFISANDAALAASRRIELLQADTGIDLSGILRELRSIQGVSQARSGAGTTQHRSKAIRLLDAALQSQQGDAHLVDIEALMARAMLDAESHRWAEARGLYEGVLREADRQHADDTLLSLHKDPAAEARAELAWCTVMMGDLQTGKEQLLEATRVLDADAARPETEQLFQDEHRARAWWRLGQCALQQTGSGSADVEPSEAFNYYITALKRHPSFAPAFTSLGTYYEQYAKPADPTRSSKCFQKAFELDSREFHAAYKLADHYASEREWDLVSLISKRVIEGEGGAQVLNSDAGFRAAQQRYKPQNAWAWKATGSVRLERGDPEGAITPLQIALRSTPDDATIWQRLGEAYSKTGRYTAALKAFAKASEVDPASWQTLYFIAEVRRSLGQYEEAIELLNQIQADQGEGVELGVRIALGETYLQKSHQEFLTGYVVRAEQSLRSTLGHALAVIEKDAQLRSSWKIVTDALFALGRFGTLSAGCDIWEGEVHRLLEIVDRVYPSIDKDLPAVDVVTRGEVSTSANDHGIVALAACCYLSKLRVILCASDNHTLPSAWADLSAALARYSLLLTRAGEQSATSQLTKQSISCIKAALNHEPANASFWMVLGNLTFSSSVQISQHAYIRAIESNSASNVQDATPWTNLGLLYLEHGDEELANEAFIQARTVDPDHATAWAGQALLAARQGRESEARSIFDNAIDLSQGSLMEADYGYADGIFRSSSSAGDHNSTALTVLKAYLSHHPADSTVLHLSALFCERLGMYAEAQQNLETAKGLLEEEYDRTESQEVATRFGVVMCDLGRVQEREGNQGQLEEAVQNIESGLGLLDDQVADGDEGDGNAPVLSPTDTSRAKLSAHCTLARIRHRQGNTNAALQSLSNAERVVHSIPTGTINHNLSSDITNLRAHILYTTEENKDEAKNVLLGSLDSSVKDMRTIVSLLAISIIDDDQELLEEVVSELESWQQDPEAVIELKAMRKFSRGKDDDGLAVLQQGGKSVEMRLLYLNALIRKISIDLCAENAWEMVKLAKSIAMALVASVHTEQEDLISGQTDMIWRYAAVISILERWIGAGVGMTGDSVDQGSTGGDADFNENPNVNANANADTQPIVNSATLANQLLQTATPTDFDTWRTLALIQRAGAV